MLNVSDTHDVGEYTGSSYAGSGTIALNHHRVFFITLGGEQHDVVGTFQIVEWMLRTHSLQTYASLAAIQGSNKAPAFVLYIERLALSLEIGIEQIKNQYADLMERSKLKLNVVGIASSKNAIFNRDGIDLENYSEELKSSDPSTPEVLRDTILAMNIFNSVFVDCTASKDVAALYQSLLEHNVSIIAANKIAASSEYENYEKLKKTAIQRGVVFRFETNVGAGLPIIGTINDLRNSGDKILKIEAVLSGTLNFIFNAISSVVPFSETVRLAKEKGYSEPDPRIDLSGMDVIRKLVILSREAGYRVEQEDVEKNLFVPDKYFKGSLDNFWKKLPELDADFEAKRKALDVEHKRWRFVATLDGGKTSVGLQAVGPEHPFYNLEGSNNIVLLTTERYKEYPMMIQGYGAGASVTAAGVFANIMSIANI